MDYFIVDVFAETPYSGNQLAVVVGNPSRDAMQRIAREFNYSETTFITSTTPRGGGYDTRIFTPVSELPFAGHPTLGTAFVIQHAILNDAAADVTLNVPVGSIPVRASAEGRLWMRQNPPQFGDTYDTADVASVLGLSPDDFDRRYPVQEVSTGLPWIIVPLKDAQAVDRVAVDVAAFRALIDSYATQQSADVIFVFSPAAQQQEGHDLYARGFAHFHGSPEDPATGSANGNLAGYLVQQRYFGDDLVQVAVAQGYQMGRPSMLYLDAGLEGETIRVEVGGRVQMIARGTLQTLPD